MILNSFMLIEKYRILDYVLSYDRFVIQIPSCLLQKYYTVNPSSTFHILFIFRSTERNHSKNKYQSKVDIFINISPTMIRFPISYQLHHYI
jgi:hypothetical protein